MKEEYTSRALTKLASIEQRYSQARDDFALARARLDTPLRNVALGAGIIGATVASRKHTGKGLKALGYIGGSALTARGIVRDHDQVRNSLTAARSQQTPIDLYDGGIQ